MPAKSSPEKATTRQGPSRGNERHILLSIQHLSFCAGSEWYRADQPPLPPFLTKTSPLEALRKIGNRHVKPNWIVPRAATQPEPAGRVLGWDGWDGMDERWMGTPTSANGGEHVCGSREGERDRDCCCCQTSRAGYPLTKDVPPRAMCHVPCRGGAWVGLAWYLYRTGGGKRPYLA